MYTPIGPLSFVFAQNLSKADSDKHKHLNLN